MELVAGVDIGSLTAKIVVLGGTYNDRDSIKQKYSFIRRVGYNPIKIAKDLINEAENAIGNKSLAYIVSTGYGRKLVEIANERITEITCHATGAFFVNPDIRTIIDIGGQDSKVIQINEIGQIQDFEMNDKCSAGTGRFLEVMANTLEVELAEFGNKALISKNPATISSTCTVFAESEVISRLNQGANRLDIIAGIHTTITNKIAALTARVGVKSLVALTGGVALNPGVKKMLEHQLNVLIEVPSNPQMIGALGAALLASKHLHDSSN
ncbi:MAG: 2-hydroxyglutaryl-CoA dehydratase [Candidatus Heimdallarchaeota archaeon]|nr:MAG: 2-hydroxyglutaryl-CoA dehydratase [Candidatus Heimdallarchaeota archaeon]